MVVPDVAEGVKVAVLERSPPLKVTGEERLPTAGLEVLRVTEAVAPPRTWPGPTTLPDVSSCSAETSNCDAEAFANVLRLDVPSDAVT